jgi:hypothetical protein
LSPDQPLKEYDRTVAVDISRGIQRLLVNLGYRALTEFTLKNNRRADVIALNKQGRIIIVEVKSSAADFRSDSKWSEYLEFCDRFYFAVNTDFPQEILPADQGMIIADRYGGEILREAEDRKVNGTRRKTLTLNFARSAAQRLQGISDPGI